MRVQVECTEAAIGKALKLLPQHLIIAVIAPPGMQNWNNHLPVRTLATPG